MLRHDNRILQLHAHVANKFELPVDPGFFTKGEIQND